MPSTSLQQKTKVTIEAQGRLLRVQAHLDGDEPFTRRGIRGKVHEFSAGSRMRLYRFMARLEGPDTKGYRSKTSFLTLTTRECLHPRVFKVLSFRFFRILKDKFPSMAVIWRLEYQERGAPHIHCILYNAPWVDKKWVQAQWGKIVGQDEPFTRIERVRTYKKLMVYVAKYVGKVGTVSGFNIGTYSDRNEGLTYSDLETQGRVWGVYNRRALPYARVERAEIDQGGAWWLIRRYCQRYYAWLEEDSMTGFTVFMDDPYHALAHIVHMDRVFAAV